MVVKRFRLMAMDFDARAQALNMAVGEAVDPQVRQQMVQNQRIVYEQLLHEYGVLDYERKVADFIDLGSAPFSLLAFPNSVLPTG